MCRDSFTWGKFSKKRNPIENFCAKEYESHGKKRHICLPKNFKKDLYGGKNDPKEI